ncbi:MAG: hypothetical protein WDA59_08160 [Methanofastidiosum sp.]|jgi:hypothetical protein|nr:hypothetical protein [Candidatus Izemoplasmatales bacterium]
MKPKELEKRINEMQKCLCSGKPKEDLIYKVMDIIDAICKENNKEMNNEIDAMNLHARDILRGDKK